MNFIWKEFYIKGMQESDDNIHYDYLFVIPIARGWDLKNPNIS
jgi:hypothetical protein